MRIPLLTIIATVILSGSAIADTHTVQANSSSFSPDTLEVSPGDTITWQYNTGYPHTVTSGIPCTPDGLFHSDLNGSNPTFTWDVPMDALGDIPYFCDPHCLMGMHGMISVVGDGEIINVPGDYPTIQGAIDASSDGDLIQVSSDTFYEDSLNPGGKAITIQGTLNRGGNLATKIDAQQNGSVFRFDSGEGLDTVIKDLVLTGGSASYGGGIECFNSSPTITNCTFLNNTATSGGGMYNSGSSPDLNGCLFEHNTASYGGGMRNQSSSPTLVNCIFAGNIAEGIFGYGGGMANYYSNPVIESCVFENNTVITQGGGAYNYKCTPTLADSIICGNTPNQVYPEGSFTDGGGNTIEDDCSVCSGDINGDGHVGVDDLLAVIADWQNPYTVDDLLLVIGGWGPCP